jgi:hypothetical protein
LIRNTHPDVRVLFMSGYTYDEVAKQELVPQSSRGTCGLNLAFFHGERGWLMAFVDCVG